MTKYTKKKIMTPATQTCAARNNDLIFFSRTCSFSSSVISETEFRTEKKAMYNTAFY